MFTVLVLGQKMSKEFEAAFEKQGIMTFCVASEDDARELVKTYEPDAIVMKDKLPILYDGTPTVVGRNAFLQFLNDYCGTRPQYNPAVVLYGSGSELVGRVVECIDSTISVSFVVQQVLELLKSTD